MVLLFITNLTGLPTLNSETVLRKCRDTGLYCKYRVTKPTTQKAKDMNNSERTTKFLSVITAEAKDMILKSIAAHYGVTKDEIYAELTDPEAEHLLEYMVEPHRSAAHIVMKRHNMVGW